MSSERNGMNHRLRAVLESISDGFFALDNQLVVTYFNSASETMLGRKREEVLGRKLFDAFPEAKGSIFDEQYHWAVRHKQPVTFETYFGIPPYDNWYDVKVYPAEEGISIYFRVITERKRTEEALSRYREELERQVAERTTELSAKNEELKREIGRRASTERELELRTRELKERVKELNCLYGISQLEVGPGMDVEDVLHGIVRLIPTAMRNPEKIAARIVLEDREYATGGLLESNMKQTRDIVVQGRSVGYLEVSLFQEPADLDGGRFGTEELKLLDAVAERVGRIVERKRAEDELRKFATVVNRATFGSVMCDLQGKLTYMNEAFARILGYHPDELLNKHLSVLHTPEQMQTVRMQFKKLLGEGSCQNEEVWLRRKDGHEIVTLMNASVIEGDDGLPLFYSATVIDITDRRNMEDALEQGERFLSDVFDSIQDGVHVGDTNFNVIRVNRTMERWYPHAMPLVGKKCYEAYQGRSEPCEVCPVQETFETGRQARRVVKYTGPEGKHIGWLDLYSFPVIDSQSGTLKGVIEYVRDITDRRRAEDALRRSEERYRGIVETANEGIWGIDEHGNTTFANRQMARMLGTSVEDLMSSSMFDFVDPVWISEAKSLMERVTEESKGQQDIGFCRRDGSDLWGIVSARPSFDESGRFTGGFAMITDITERKRTEQLIRESLEEKEVLLREIHHRVKNNLAIIHSLLSLQSDYANDEIHRRMFEEAQDRVGSMALAHELLYQSENLAHVSVKDYVESLIDHLITSIGTLRAGISVVEEIENVSFGLDTAIPLGFILTELGSNCLKHAFTEESLKARITISLRSTGDGEFELSVDDNGIGIPTQFAVEDPKTLGLQLVRKFVRQLYGEIQIVADQGTSVRVRFKEAKKKSRRGQSQHKKDIPI